MESVNLIRMLELSQKFLEKIEKKQPLVIFGDGKNTRDFVFH